MYKTLRKLMFKLNPESAHNLAEFGLRFMDFTFPGAFSFFTKSCIFEDESLKQSLFGLDFYNPIGLSGGFDKNATMLRPLSAFGFSFLEYGTFTPYPQKGNDKPRLWRLQNEESLQNAMGFNNLGKQIIRQNVAKVYPSTIPIIANIGKNKDTKDPFSDYLELLKDFDSLCDMFLINISSPNTKNLRTLQNESFIKDLFTQAKEITKKPLLLKLAPDMQTDTAINLCKEGIKSGAAGIVLANTSIDYSLCPTPVKIGGLSGKIIQEKSGLFLKEIAKEIYGKAPIIASGGIDSARIAYERIKNGASLVQIFTSFIYQGPTICAKINKELTQYLQADGFSHIKEAIGVNLK